MILSTGAWFWRGAVFFILVHLDPQTALESVDLGIGAVSFGVGPPRPPVLDFWMVQELILSTGACFCEHPLHKSTAPSSKVACQGPNTLVLEGLGVYFSILG